MGKIKPVKESPAIAPPPPPRSNVERQGDWDRNRQGERKTCLCKNVAAELTLATLGEGGWRGYLQRFKCTTGFIFPVTGISSLGEVGLGARQVWALVHVQRVCRWQALWKWRRDEGVRAGVGDWAQDRRTRGAEKEKHRRTSAE